MSNLSRVENNEKMRKGVYLIPDKIKLRFIRQEEKAILNEKRNLLYLHYPFDSLRSIFVLELFNMDGKIPIPNIDIDLIDRILLSFRLIQDKDIFIQGIYYFPDRHSTDSVGVVPYPPIPLHYDPYRFNIDDLDPLKKTIDIITNLDFENEYNYLIACERYGRSYHSKSEEDKLIDICIALEALIMKGEFNRSDVGMGQIIGLACSMLLGKNDDDRDTISETVKTAFARRNDIVHGKKYDREKIVRLVPELKKILQKSILNLKNMHI